jgi:hypothetical protein
MNFGASFVFKIFPNFASKIFQKLEFSFKNLTLNHQFKIYLEFLKVP